MNGEQDFAKGGQWLERPSRQRDQHEQKTKSGLRLHNLAKGKRCSSMFRFIFAHGIGNFLKQEISNLHLSTLTYTRSPCLLYAFLNDDLKKDQRESQNWIYRSLLFLPYRQKSHGRPRPILSADPAHCPRGGLNDQWGP